jgi:hypothetical protein
MVLGLRNRAPATSRLDSPRATSRATRVSCEVSDSEASAALSDRERQALEQLGERLWHPVPHRRTGLNWRAIDRLVLPLNAAAAAVWRSESPHHRHAITDALGLVLPRCRREGMAFWGWPEETRVDLIGTTVAKFRSTVPAGASGAPRWSPVVLSGKVGHVTAEHLSIGMAEGVFRTNRRGTALTSVTDRR